MKSCVKSKKGAGQFMARPRWWYGPDYRRSVKPPKQEEKAVCTRSEACKDCPFPASGFVCWGNGDECMRTRLEKMKENRV